jgi:hypothetical protein
VLGQQRDLRCVPGQSCSGRGCGMHTWRPDPSGPAWRQPPQCTCRHARGRAPHSLAPGRARSRTCKRRPSPRCQVRTPFPRPQRPGHRHYQTERRNRCPPHQCLPTKWQLQLSEMLVRPTKYVGKAVQPSQLNTAKGAIERQTELEEPENFAQTRAPSLSSTHHHRRGCPHHYQKLPPLRLVL